MKYSILAIIVACMAFGCSSSKKTTESTQKDLEALQRKMDSTVASYEAKIKDFSKKKEESTSATKTKVTYKPEIDPATGKTKPFEMQTTRNGQPSSSVKVDGNGEVVIENLTNEIQQSEEEHQSEINTMNAKFNTQLSEERKKSSEFEETVKTKSTSILKLYLIIALLVIALLISLYFNFKRRVKILP